MKVFGLLSLLMLAGAFGCAAVSRPAEPPPLPPCRPLTSAEAAHWERATRGRAEAAWRAEGVLPDAPRGWTAFLCRDARGALWCVTVRLPAAVAEPPAFVGAIPFEASKKGTLP